MTQSQGEATEQNISSQLHLETVSLNKQHSKQDLA